MDARHASVGSNIRQLRRQVGMSVVELARRAEIGRATLTQLEAGSGNPTLETLYAVANELGVTLADLIADAEPEREPRVVRAGEGPFTAGGAVEAHLLCRSHPPGLTVEIYAITLVGDQPQLSAAHPPGTREHVHLHSGRATVGPVDRPVTLDRGDYVDFRADRPHQYHRRAGTDVRATLTMMTRRGAD